MRPGKVFHLTPGRGPELPLDGEHIFGKEVLLEPTPARVQRWVDDNLPPPEAFVSKGLVHPVDEAIAGLIRTAHNGAERIVPPIRASKARASQAGSMGRTAINLARQIPSMVRNEALLPPETVYETGDNEIELAEEFARISGRSALVGANFGFSNVDYLAGALYGNGVMREDRVVFLHDIVATKSSEELKLLADKRFLLGWSTFAKYRIPTIFGSRIHVKDSAATKDNLPRVLESLHHRVIEDQEQILAWGFPRTQLSRLSFIGVLDTNQLDAGQLPRISGYHDAALKSGHALAIRAVGKKIKLRKLVPRIPGYNDKKRQQARFPGIGSELLLDPPAGSRQVGRELVR